MDNLWITSTRQKVVCWDFELQRDKSGIEERIREIFVICVTEPERSCSPISDVLYLDYFQSINTERKQLQRIE